MLENAPDVFDGALPFMGGGDVRPFPATERIKGAQVMSFACMFNVQRLLRSTRPRRCGVIDAMQPGGSGDPFAGLNSHERDELASPVQAGVPVRERVHDLLADGADLAVDVDRRPARGAGPGLFRRTSGPSPGYVGHDIPEAVLPDLIDETVTVDRVITPKDLLTDPAFAGPEYMLMKAMAGIMAGDPDELETPYAVQLSGLSGPATGSAPGCGWSPVTRRAASCTS